MTLLFFNSAAVYGQSENSAHAAKQKLIVAVMEMPPYSMQDEDGAWIGITVDLWKEIARIINVDYEFRKVDLKGVIKGQQDGTFDLAATGVAITAAREAKFDFTDPYLTATEAIAINVDQEPNLWQIVRATFFNWTMLGLALAVFAVALTGGVILWLLEHRSQSEHYSGKTPKAFVKSLYWSTMVMSGREFPKAIGWSTASPTTVAGRLFALCWMMLGVFLISVFTATAASVLTAKQLKEVIHDAAGLRNVRVGTLALSVGEEYLKRRHIKCEHLYTTASDLMQALADHKLDAAVYNRHIMVYYARNRYAGKIDVLSTPLRQDFLAIAMRTNCPHREEINEALTQVIESRKWQEIVSNYLGNDWVNATPP